MRRKRFAVAYSGTKAKTVKTLAIINPASGNGKTGRGLEAILDGLKTVNCDCRISRYRGECRDMARSSTGYKRILAVGGDGTVHEIINGMDLAVQTLAVVPAGTGNSLARDAGIVSIESGIAAAKCGKTRDLDLMLFRVTKANGSTHDCYGASTASIGYATRVTATANNRLKSLGHLCYPVASLACSIFPQRVPLTVSYEHGVSFNKKLTGLMIQNSRFAANFKVIPEAVLDDGFFNVMEINAGFVGQTFHNLSVLTQTHFYTPGITRKVTTMRLSLDRPGNVMIDGEIEQDVKEFNVSIAPSRLACISIR